jgi:hypothetical protein
MAGTLTEAQLLPAGTSVAERQAIGNGMGQWLAATGRTAEARRAYEAVLSTGPSASFGVLAAEAGLARLTNP